MDIEKVFMELKKQVNDNGRPLFERVKRSGNDLMFNCPVHSGGQERRPSCGINLDTGISHCFSCGFKADLTTFISVCFGKNDGGAYGAKWLAKNFVTYDGRNFNIDWNFSGDDNFIDVEPLVDEDELKQYRWVHSYMYDRKLTDDIIEKFDIGFDKAANCLTFPVRDEHGRLSFIYRRSVNSKFFSITTDADKGSVVYALDEVYKILPVKNVIICESIIDCLTCWVHNRPAVALMQAIATHNQIDLIKSLPVRSIVLALDNDEAGKIGAIRLRNALKSSKLIYKAVFDAKDINELDDFNGLKEVLY